MIVPLLNKKCQTGERTFTREVYEIIFVRPDDFGKMAF